LARGKDELNGTRRTVLLALLLSLGVGLHALEAQIPVPVALPGAKLGLANVVTLIALYAIGPAEAITLAILRVLLGSLVTGTFGSMAFMMAFAGATGSSLVMSGFKAVTSGRGRFAAPCSIAGAIAHNLFQLGVFTLVSGTAKVFVMLPYLLAVALPTGYFTGLGALYGLSALRNVPGFKRRLEGIDTVSGRRSLSGTAAVMAALLVVAFGAVKLSERIALARITQEDGKVIQIKAFVTDARRGSIARTFPWPPDGNAEEGEFEVQGRIGTSVLQYDDDLGVRFLSSPCPDKLCIKQGWVNDETDLAACLPNGLIVTVEEGK